MIFIDETWAKTNMTRTHGRAPRGRRLVAKVPHARDAGLPDAAIIAVALAALLPAIWLGVRWLPRWFLGPDGIQAIALLVEFAERRFPGLLRRPVVRHLLPLPGESEPGR